tara:strand:- start:1288 stop:1821 length:534 start_codon:yes stop_codon:yes gene_type:complete
VVYNAYKYFTEVARVRVIATKDVKRVTDAFQPDGDSGDVFSWELVHDGTTTRVGDIEIKFSRTDHPVETLAMRLTSESNSIIYTSDTGPGWSMSDLGAEPDIVIGEGTLLDANAHVSIPHISCSHLANEANKVRAKHLVVTHVPPGSDPAQHLDEAATVFEGKVELAVTGRTFSTTG